jgi:transcription elongation factor Elf1
MHNLIEEMSLTCPFCNESISVLVDGSAGSQSYIEDCEVCCRPMLVSFEVTSSGIDAVRAERGD